MSNVTINPGDSVLTKASAVGVGDSVVFAPGVHQSAPIQLIAGVKYLGTPGKTFWKFNTGGDFALKAPPNLFIDGIMLENNGGLILASNLDGANATRCGLKFDGTGNNAVGIRSTNGTKNTKIETNYFHDSPKSFRDCDLWGVNGLSYSRNSFRNTCYGAHIIIADGINNILGNTGVGYDQMSIEVQDFGIVHGRGEVNYNDNVMYGWRTGSTGGQNNAFGYSFGTQFCGALRTKNNYICLGYFDANGKYVEAPRNGGDHWGYGGEHGGMNVCTVDGSIFIGSWVQALVTMTRGTMNGVKVYGNNQWGPWGGESGNSYQGSWTSTGNSQGNLPIASAPKPARIVTDTPWDDSGGVITIPPDNTMKLILSTPTDTGFDWELTGAPATGGTMAVKDGSAKPIGVAFPITGNKGTVTNCPSNWGLLVSVRQTVGGVNTDASASTHTTGTAAADWQAEYSRQPAVKGTQPPPAGSFHVDITGGFDIVDGKPVNLNFKPIVSAK